MAAGTFSLPDETPGDLAKYVVSPTGHLYWLTRDGYLGALPLDAVGDPELPGLVWHRLSAGSSFHNDFPVDEAGSIVLVSPSGLTGVDFDGTRFAERWTVPYDTTSSTLNGRHGSGTTPTLLGGPGDPDQLVAVVDGRNRLVLVWRDEIPGDWAGLPGLDRRVAAVVPLAFAPPGESRWSIENSPAASGYELVTAQYSGVRPECSAGTGVGKLRWDPDTDRVSTVWTTEVAVNSVLTVSEGSGIAYGNGLEGCSWVFYGLDWQTGEVVLRQPLGDSRKEWGDGGVGIALDSDCSLYWSSPTAIVRVRPAAATELAGCRAEAVRLGFSG